MKIAFIVHTLEEVVEKINFLLKDTSLRHQMSQAAKETAKQFRSDAMIETTLALYKRILAEKGT